MELDYRITKNDVSIIIETRLASHGDISMTFYCEVGFMPMYHVYVNGNLAKSTGLLETAIFVYNALVSD